MDRFKALIVLFVVFIAASSSAQPHETGALFSIGPTFAGGRRGRQFKRCFGREWWRICWF